MLFLAPFFHLKVHQISFSEWQAIVQRIDDYFFMYFRFKSYILSLGMSLLVWHRASDLWGTAHVVAVVRWGSAVGGTRPKVVVQNVCGQGDGAYANDGQRLELHQLWGQKPRHLVRAWLPVQWQLKGTVAAGLVGSLRKLDGLSLLGKGQSQGDTQRDPALEQ